MSKAPPSEVRAKVLRPFKVELRTAAAAGYEWNAVFDPDDFRLLGHKKVICGNRMGGAGKDIFRFSPLAKGDFEIRFRLQRPWEDTAADEKQVTLHVE